MEREISCDVCRDLIPLVRDEVASADSIALVERHVAYCPACRAELGNITPAPAPSDNSVIQKLRRAISLRAAALVGLGTVLGLSLQWDETFVYNLAIMPAVGAVLYLFCGKKWYCGPCILAMVGSMYQLVALGRDAIGLAVWIGFSYGLLALLGGGIAALFRYAFGKKKGE